MVIAPVGEKILFEHTKISATRGGVITPVIPPGSATVLGTGGFVFCLFYDTTNNDRTNDHNGDKHSNRNASDELGFSNAASVVVGAVSGRSNITTTVTDPSRAGTVEGAESHILHVLVAPKSEEKLRRRSYMDVTLHRPVATGGRGGGLGPPWKNLSPP